MWINGIIDAARNSDIVFGAQGYIDVSQNIKKLQVTEGKVDASMGHVHPDGNPHYFTNPENVKNIIDIVVKQLSGIAPEQTDFLTKNKEDYIAQLEEYITKWKKMFESFKGTKIITYHDSWPYFEEFSGLKIIEHIEPKPGIPPSPSHLQKLVNLIKNENVKLILSENYFSKKAPQFLKEKTGIKIIYVPVDLQKDQGIDSYIQLWDKNFQQMIEALK